MLDWLQKKLFGLNSTPAEDKARLDRLMAEAERRGIDVPPSAYEWEDYFDAGWDEFAQESWQNIKEAPARVGNAIGEAVGGVAGNVTRGAFRAWANPVSIGAAILVAIVAWWAFTRGPLSQWKVK